MYTGTIKTTIIHRDLMMTSIQDEITKFANNREIRLDQHTNPAEIQLIDNSQYMSCSNTEDHGLV